MTEFLFAMAVFLTGRFVCFSNDKPRSTGSLMVIACCQSVAVATAVNWGLFRCLALTAAFLFTAVALPWTERIRPAKNSVRLLLRLLLIVIMVATASVVAASTTVVVRPPLLSLGRFLGDHLVFGRVPMKWPQVWAVTVGMQLCFLESSTAVRLALIWARVTTPDPAKTNFRHSQIIGAIERDGIHLRL